GRFSKRKGMLEFALPLCVRTERVAGNRFALGLDCEHFAGVIENRSDGVLFRAPPFRIGERAEFRRTFANADVARNEISLLERNVELRFIGELKREHFLFTVCRCWNLCETREPRDAVFEMNHEIVFGELAEIDLSSVSLGVIKPAPRVRRETSEQFGGG